MLQQTHTEHPETDPAVTAFRAWQAAQVKVVKAIGEEGRCADLRGFGSPEHKAAETMALGSANDAEKVALHRVAWNDVLLEERSPAALRQAKMTRMPRSRSMRSRWPACSDTMSWLIARQALPGAGASPPRRRPRAG